MASNKLTSLVALLMLAGICTTAEAQKIDFQTKIDFQKRWKASSCGVDKPGRKIVKDAIAWKTLWKQVHSRVDPSPLMPDIDFNKQTVIAVFMGQQKTGGYEIRIVRIDDLFRRIEVRVRETSPKSGAITTQALTQPYDIVAISKSGKKILFKKVE